MQLTDKRYLGYFRKAKKIYHFKLLSPDKKTIVCVSSRYERRAVGGLTKIIFANKTEVQTPLTDWRTLIMLLYKILTNTARMNDDRGEIFTELSGSSIVKKMTNTEKKAWLVCAICLWKS